MTTLESLAVTRLRRWAQDRTAIRHGKIVRCDRDGWIERRSRTADARQVAVIDFERAFATLDTNDQITLLLTYRDAVPARHAADILGLTPSMVHFHARQALTRLANVLDRLDLL